MIDRTVFRDLVAEASLTPSVHNVQPARWSLRPDAIVLLEDRTRRLAAGDPSGRDALVSLGAACEAMVIALSRRGIGTSIGTPEASTGGDLVEIRRLRPVGRVEADTLSGHLPSRSSHRGAFDAVSASERAAAAALASDELGVLDRPEDVREIADLGAEAGHGFMRDVAFRRELVSWMRLSRSHPRWSRDGLNADAMAMGRIEALGARAVLGLLFGTLQAAGAARPLLSDAAVTRTATAIVALHLPRSTDPFEIGRRFLRAWLTIERAGFKAAVMASLVDHPSARARLSSLMVLDDDRSIEAVWRIGRTAAAPPARARLDVDDLIVGT